MSTYGTPSIALTRGSGTTVWDEDGNAYVDLVAGIAVNALGHAHPALIDAVASQMQQLGHVSNLYASAPAIELAERLLDLFREQGPFGKVFFCNSGAEANEAAFKIARRTGRPKILAATGSFHGRTMGSLALTGQPAKQQPFLPLPGVVEHVPYGDVDALKKAVDADTAAVILEPILGEGGIIPAPPGYLAAAREITSECGALLIVDEVQTGIGRTGAWFGFQRDEIEPDVVTLAKGLGGGIPIGACIAFGPAATLLQPGQHGSTFGGNPVSCAAALAVIDTIASEGLVENAASLGMKLMLGIDAIKNPLIAGVRGHGLLIGIGLAIPCAKDVEAAAARAGFLVNAVQPDVIRLAPSLNITEAEVDAFLEALPTILDQVE